MWRLCDSMPGITTRVVRALTSPFQIRSTSKDTTKSSDVVTVPLNTSVEPRAASFKVFQSEMHSALTDTVPTQATTRTLPNSFRITEAMGNDCTRAARLSDLA